MLDTLKSLCALPGVSSGEEPVRTFISREIMSFVDEMQVDPLGNLIAFRQGSLGNKKRLLLAAHMDEVGLIVRHITQQGHLKFDFVGGVDRRVAIGQRFLIGKSGVPGIVALKAAHLSKGETTVPKVSDLYLDIGASSREEATHLVELGDLAVFESPVRLLGDGSMLKARAIDDRAGCAVLMELAKKAPLWDTYYVFTAQEEVGTRGAQIAASRICPDLALVLEGTTAADLPSVALDKRICSPGKGVVIPFMDRGAVYDRGLYAFLTALARENQIPWQTKQYISGGTDAQAIQRAGGGVRTAALAVAVRNIHSAASLASIADLEAMQRLAGLFMERLDSIDG